MSDSQPVQQNVDTGEDKDVQSGIEDDHRTRTLTEKGQALYGSTKQEYSAKIDRAWKTVQIQIANSETCASDLQALRCGEKDLTRTFDKFREVASEFAEYLARVGTEDSKQDLESHNLRFSGFLAEMENAASRFDRRIQETLEKISHHTNNTRSEARSRRSISSGSTTSSLLARKRAKAEAARAAVEFAAKEAELLRQSAIIDEQKQVAAAQAERKMAELEAERQLLQQQKKAAEAEAEVNVLNANTSVEEVRNSHIALSVQDAMERTRMYVSELKESVCEDGSQLQHNQSTDPVIGPQARNNQRSQPLNPNAPVYQPMHPGTELSRFLLKKDLLLSRLRNYNDQPESYTTWKAGFKSVMRELDVTPDEELDLLAKWLGPASSKYALSIRAANAHDPQKGIETLWQRLDERYGSPEMVEASLKARLANFPKLTNRDNKRLYELSDLLCEIESVKACERYSTLLAYYDSSSGVIPVVQKLPYSLQGKWTNQAFKYKEQHKVSFPPFSVFVEFVRQSSKVRNDPSFAHEANFSVQEQKEKFHPTPKQLRPSVYSRKTEVLQPHKENVDDVMSLCPLHKTKHTLNQCKTFRTKTYGERKEFLKRHGICYKCCASTNHIALMCKHAEKCSVCESPSHATALHVDYHQTCAQSSKPLEAIGGEKDQTAAKSIRNNPISSKCTQICGDGFSGKSCAKTILVNVYPKGRSELSVRMYAILDDQSNTTLARTGFFNAFNIECEEVSYILSSCAGVIETSGRKADGFVVESVDGCASLELPTIIECNSIPNQRNEIPTPDVARHFSHLTDIASHIPPLDESSDILLLIGRDMIQAHHVYDHRIGPGNSPYAQKLPLGWVVIGESCLGKMHKPDFVNVCKVNLLKDERPSIFKPCPNSFELKEMQSPDFLLTNESSVGDSVFQVTKQDDKPGLSVEDRKFLQMMSHEMYKGSEGNWVAPLPFKSQRPVLPNNMPQALKRAHTLDRSIKRDPVKRKHVIDFMAKIFDNSHAERAPPLQKQEECWYLPLFGVYHPKKQDQIRMVFDSSAQYNGISLNNVLLQGPDMTNGLLDILLRFRRHAVGVMCDIQQMFYCFQVKQEHRNYLRFLWYEDNDPDKPLTEYRMRVHVFGNRPSPAIATYGLHKTAEAGQFVFGEDVEDFVKRDFYVDDGLVSKPTADEAVDLVKRTQQSLQTFGNLRLHKITSNSSEVMKAFPSDDLATDFKDLDFEEGTFPLQRSLGILWDVRVDTFTFRWSDERKPYTKRGVLSTINSIYDPMGFVAPVVIKGKILLRELISQKVEWDEPLPSDYQQEWENWRDSLKSLEQLQIPRAFLPVSLSHTTKKELCVYADASEKAISAVAYFRCENKDGNVHFTFLLGKSKVAPTHGHTIPRLELCAAVLAVEIGNMVCECLDISPSSVSYFTDSRIVLGYISNDTRRFLVYVANRVASIRKLSSPQQWRYVSTESNPADCGTRSIQAKLIQNSPWLNGPSQHPEEDQCTDTVLNEDLESSVELPQEVISCATTVQQTFGKLGSHRFERFSNWERLVETIAHLQQFVQSHSGKVRSEANLSCTGIVGAKAFTTAENFIIQQVQHEFYAKEIECIRAKIPLPKDSPILTLNPVIDDMCMLRVGGRLSKADLNIGHKNPLVIPGSHYIATLLVRNYHEQVKHQGRHFTEGAIRAAGLWITGVKRLINSLIFKCVKCRRLRGQEAQQKMADLPIDRLTPSPPFTFVGVDTFGPWSVVARRTRGGQANSKRWALLFTCLVIRAIHIELIDELSTSAFINALRRFISIRGKVKEFRSDRGTNFIGAASVLNVDAVNVEDEKVKRFLTGSKATWVFNPPHSSHMGGVWERMIGTVRRILDSMLTNMSSKGFTHDVLSTLMAEVCAIVNARPIVHISTDPDIPGILSPSAMLTQKSDHVEGLVTNYNFSDLYKSQWKLVQSLADQFWRRWKNDYLHTLQSRRKWFHDKPNIAQGDIVLLKEKNTARNEWPIGIVEKAIESEDGKIRKAIIRVVRENTKTRYTRPITEMVVLLPAATVN